MIENPYFIDNLLFHNFALNYLVELLNGFNRIVSTLIVTLGGDKTQNHDKTVRGRHKDQWRLIG